jgi:hypothetical protein
VPNSFDIDRFTKGPGPTDQYQRQLRRLASAGRSVEAIEAAVAGALSNLSGDGRKSFVIYGEPQSGKTEMMICLTAKLLDTGRRFIIHLLNDSVDLLGQNLGRFQSSGLAPSAQSFNDILDPSIDVSRGRYVVFCKKNAKDLRKLCHKVGRLSDVVVIDDEADYASPNAKVNQNEKTKINELISEILSHNGDYIGVTATPARLDLNNTFDNDSSLWVHFRPHPLYTGQDVFFPFEDEESRTNHLSFQLRLLPDKGDDPKYARTALFSFLVNVAYLNNYSNSAEENYSFLIHTSGKKEDHKSDWNTIKAALDDLSNRESKNFSRYIQEVWQIVHDRYPDADPDELTIYIRDNVGRNTVVILNSDRDLSQRGSSATKPASLFTIVIGGNIVSRGVTFDNLLSMFFTRDVKHKIQQDTYIQRARMFGSRGSYLRHFELTIPEALYGDWHRCFVFHRLSLASINNGKGSPVWLADSRIAAVAGSSIDRSSVLLDKGEMGFALFDYTDEIDTLIHSSASTSSKFERLAELVGDDAFPSYVRRFIRRMSENFDEAVAIQKTADVYPGMSPDEQQFIFRPKGLMGASQLVGTEYTVHFLKVFRNSSGKARLYYKYTGSIQFIRNLKSWR